jgi:MSHA biogenesis protein MshJ
MTQFLQAALLRFQALSGRERVLAVAAALAVLVVGVYQAVLAPQRHAMQLLQQQLAQQQDGLAAMAKVLAQPVANPLADASVAARDALRLRVAHTELVLGPPRSDAQLSEVVRTLAAPRADLALVSLKTLAPQEIAKPGPRPTSATPQAPTALAASARPLPLYKHGVEVVVRGPYPALVAYLQTLQRNPNRIFWAKVRLDVATYPQAVLMLTVYTVSNRAESPLG